MALIVETGEGLQNANGYASLAESNTYHNNRGNDIWNDLTDLQKEQSLIRATDYITQAYRQRWKGSRTTGMQALDWPRAYVELDDLKPRGVENYDFLNGLYLLPNNIVPNEVKNACIELALKASLADLSPDIAPQGNVIAESVDGAVSVQYSDKATPRFTVYRAIDNMLKPLLTNSGTTFRVSR